MSSQGAALNEKDQVVNLLYSWGFQAMHIIIKRDKRVNLMAFWCFPLHVVMRRLPPQLEGI